MMENPRNLDDVGDLYDTWIEDIDLDQEDDLSKIVSNTQEEVAKDIKNGHSLKDALNKAKHGANEVKGDLVNATEKALGRAKGLGLPNGKLAAIAGAVVGGAFLLNAVRGDDKIGEDNLISASVLGLPEAEVRDMMSRSSSIGGFNKNLEEKATFGALKAGREVHKQVEKSFEGSASYVGSEVSIVDPYLGVKGISDLVLDIDGQEVPVEVKTVDAQRLRSMASPTRAHAAQANFYAHGLGSDHAFVMYVNRDDPEERRSFRVAYDPGSLLADVKKFRDATYMSAHGGGWQQPLERFFGNRSGTRDQASRHYLGNMPKTPQEDNSTYVGSRYLPR